MTIPDKNTESSTGSIVMTQSEFEALHATMLAKKKHIGILKFECEAEEKALLHTISRTPSTSLLSKLQRLEILKEDVVRDQATLLRVTKRML
jgi:hypothetical protein